MGLKGRALSRRKLIQLGAAVSAAGAMLATPLRAFASRPAFDATEVDGALAALLGGRLVEESADIKFKIPDIAENGAVVPVSVSTDMDGVTGISIVIDGNPNPLVARFAISPETAADVSARVKMGQSSVVRAYVETADKVYTTSKEVKVTIGGCGG